MKLSHHAKQQIQGRNMDANHLGLAIVHGVETPAKGDRVKFTHKLPCGSVVHVVAGARHGTFTIVSAWYRGALDNGWK